MMGNSVLVTDGTAEVGSESGRPSYTAVWDGTDWIAAPVVAVAGSAADAGDGSDVSSVAPYLFNDTTWDRQRGNTEGTALASAARTATANSAILTNHSARGIILFLNITVASGTGGLQAYIRWVDPVSGATKTPSAFNTAETTTGLNLYQYYPSQIAGGGGSFLTALPRSFMVTVFANDASSYTYSVGYSLLL